MKEGDQKDQDLRIWLQRGLWSVVSGLSSVVCDLQTMRLTTDHKLLTTDLSIANRASPKDVLPSSPIPHPSSPILILQRFHENGFFPIGLVRADDALFRRLVSGFLKRFYEIAGARFIALF
jgi:hypothetical protein